MPHRGGRHGPLPPLLLGLTLVTGLVDAFSYLVLGHVFVANMTGNVVFLGFAIAGAPGFSIPASLVALGSFVCGALIGGKAVASLGQHRGHLLATATSFQTVLLGASVVAAVASGDPVDGAYRYVLIVLLGVAMGIQNATARKLAIPDLTTTVLTLTITGMAADSAIAGGAGSAAGRRLVAVTAMFVGALARRGARPPRRHRRPARDRVRRHGRSWVRQLVGRCGRSELGALRLGLDVGAGPSPLCPRRVSGSPPPRSVVTTTLPLRNTRPGSVKPGVP